MKIQHNLRPNVTPRLLIHNKGKTSGCELNLFECEIHKRVKYTFDKDGAAENFQSFSPPV
jgi:hypothetical protein